MSVPNPARRALRASTVVVLAGGLLSGCGAVVATTSAPTARTAAPVARTTAPAAPPVQGTPAAAPPVGRQPASATARPVPAGADSVEVDKCWTNATATSGGQLLVSARSSDPAAHLLAYRADGRLIGEVQNGRGQRYGGTVFAWQATDPVSVTVRSSSGGSVTVPTTPWRPEN
ncbi:hypothetical protein [Terrabacter sp. 2RAF25]|uniref:hypothetical protein n=1 Tax=Terrabacter sp. 2RAF25 TaxID=3232998 RepID=UPI003F9E1CEE